ncbi:Ldh family oxidoreductase [Chelativorans salis]|uniref:Ldh family oxidoreductase n=1 Tax=Chelativorans salis TaxID=2978478 RepID=A0ABT2LRP2_9HYPH|nr:Ldh family oxidoreductase [Chelativorans sp. EGI FJ00035]MCT7377211.1 Ldh family oxidoreductase [Chelativorans sp. EGI FJ00035]
MRPELGPYVAAALWRRQMLEILRAWRMSDAHAQVTADVLGAADLMGIDSHGMALLPLYHQQIQDGGATATPIISVVHDRAAVALIDGDAGFGQVPGMMAVELAAERAEKFGIAAVAIRNSNHYGAAGVYVRRLAEQGLIGISTSSVWRAAIVPTGGLEPRLGTNPIAFAAPSARGKPFLLDMATSTAAIGKLKLAQRAETDIPEGWALTREGSPQRDPNLALLDTLLVPLGGHKGYGLAAMVEVLSSVLSGAALTPLRGKPGKRHDVGHFVLALDPAMMRGSRAEFEADLDRMTDALRQTPPANPARPVMVAGDPEYACEAERLSHGIPLPAKLAEQLRGIAEQANAAFLLKEERAST